ncbi:NAD(P)-binding domain-containing protein [Amycolatopsis sp. SID8362]|uniref:NADPH-dependent F420 reductase n=1 Tax=Amycolatopsis sp. SID8362 TaxID=2690346 RepID=UPI001367CEAF|nr:NAD(P)-binding domain-containing protein [Amycolatopsis sp. SID8362]NBH07468.1 NAD(P)-binding domain-containing protein [Amycolatopsis sp. SID8362]NED44164.1 NAD(P)-binding domain-containing protein [Amycolatopsis sp. SID8362]
MDNRSGESPAQERKSGAAGGVDVILAADHLGNAQEVADGIGPGVKVAETADAVARGDQVVFATWFATTKDLLATYRDQLVGKIVIDPSNNIEPDDAGGVRSLNPDGVSAGQQLSQLLPDGARYVKAFGTLPAEALDATTTDAGATPVLFYATDDKKAGLVVADLISAAGFDPVRAGGIDATGRIEVFGDLHPFGGLDGRLLDRREAERLVKG